MIAGHSLAGTTIGITVSLDGVHLQFFAEVLEIVRLPDQLEWTRSQGVAEDDQRRAARREVERWVSQNAGTVQGLIDQAHHNRPVPSEAERLRSERFRFWLNVWDRVFRFNQALGGKAAARVMIVFSALSAVALFYLPDDVPHHAERLVALSFSLLAVIALLPLGLEWALVRVWRRYRRL